MQGVSDKGDYAKSVSNRISAPNSFDLVNKLKNISYNGSNKLTSLRDQDDAKYKNKLTSKSDNNFKYLSQQELEAAVKRVRRAKQKKRDDEKWKNFIKSRQESTGTVEEDNCVVCTARESNSCVECGLVNFVSSRPSSACRLEEEVCRQGETAEKDVGVVSKNDNIVSHIYQLGPGLTKRLQDLLAMVGKMTSLLVNPGLRSQCEGEDVDRTIKRSLEFDAMFARNHLYEIQRQLKDTKQLTTGKSTVAELENKISAALKSVTQALQVYTKHISKCSRVKYQQVVPIFQSINSIHRLLEHLTGQRLFPLRQEIEVACSYVKQILLEISVTETVTMSTVSQKTAKPKQKHKPSADLSMYNRRRQDWRRKTASLARARFGPPTVKTQAPPKESVIAKEVPFRNATRAVPEEQIKTQMEMIPHETPEMERKPGNSEGGSRPISAKRVPSNVQLVCLTEGAPRTDSSSTQIPVEPKPMEDCVTLTVDEADRAAALDYRQKMAEYHKSSPHYKDGKALGIINRLTNRILTEMIRDLQDSEMDDAVKMLYKMEFE